MNAVSISEEAKAVVRRNTDEVQGRGNFDVFEEIFAPTHRKIQFETVDVMRVQDGKITEHWGVANLLSLMQQIGGWTPPPSAAIER